MHKTFVTVNEHIRFRKNGTASFEGGAFMKPESNIEGRWKDFANFTMFKPKGMQWVSEGLYPTDIIPCSMKCYANGVRVIIPDYDDEEEHSQAPHPSPNKGKPLYSRVSNLKYGGKMRQARVSGDTKLELTLLKNGQLADLGKLVQDLMTAYENLAFELEMEEYDRLCEPAA